ncbi:unnamed protein product [Urochloa humidicola]
MTGVPAKGLIPAPPTQKATPVSRSDTKSTTKDRSPDMGGSIGINHAWGLSMAWRVRVGTCGVRVVFILCAQVFTVFRSLGSIES